jgi:CheY-like chemotaxis protein
MTGETIQIVEDDSLIALHIAEILENAGYQVIEPASSGEMALKALEKSPKPDLILMDIGLAGSIDGIETARRIRQHHNIPILFLSAYANLARIDEVKNIPSCGYLGKPYLEKDLLATVEKALHG